VHQVLRKRGAGVFDTALQDVFPHLDVVIGYRLLFGIYSGIVPDGIADLGDDDIDWAGDSTILLSYAKRRTAAESLNLHRSAVRLLEQWLAHSALPQLCSDITACAHTAGTNLRVSGGRHTGFH
jgi:hypothetical protein